MTLRRAAAAALAAALLAAAAGCGTATRFMIEIDGAQYTEPGPLADSSEYLVRARLTGDPEPRGDAGEAMRWWISDAVVTEVVAQRPDVGDRLAPGAALRIGTLLLDARRSGSIANFAELARDWPTEADRASAGEEVVAFLVHRPDLAGHGPGYEAVGQALVRPDGRASMRALPGPLNGDVVLLAAVTSDLRLRYAGPARWRRNGA